MGQLAKNIYRRNPNNQHTCKKNFFFSINQETRIKISMKSHFGLGTFLKISNSQRQQESSEAGFPHTLLAGMHIYTAFFGGQLNTIFPLYCT